MSRVALIASFPNPHFVDLFKTPVFRNLHETSLFCFRPMPSYRAAMDWSISDFTKLDSSWLKLKHNKSLIRDFDAYIFQGAIDPYLIPAALIKQCLKSGKPVFMASEGFKKPQQPLVKRALLKQSMNHPGLTILAIGYQSSADYRSNGIEKPIFRKFGFFEKYAQELNAPKRTDGDTIRILSVGQMIERKNHLSIINAFATGDEFSGLKIHYTICGDGVQRSKLEQAAQQLPNSIKLSMPGNLDRSELQKHFLNSDIFLIPSLYDGWGVVVNQAVHFGLPVIANIGVRSASNYLVQNGTNGFIYENDSQLRKAILTLVVDPTKRKRFSKASLEAAKDWEIEVVGRNLANLINGDKSTFPPRVPLSVIE